MGGPETSREKTFKDRNTGSQLTKPEVSLEQSDICAVRVATAQNSYELSPTPEAMNTNPHTKGLSEGKEDLPSSENGIYLSPICLWASQVAEWYRISQPMQDTQETQAPSLGGKVPWRRALQPTPVSLPGKSHGQRSLAGCSPQGCKESDTTEHTRISCLVLHVIIYTHKHTHVLAFSLLHFFTLNAVFPMKQIVTFLLSRPQMPEYLKV